MTIALQFDLFYTIIKVTGLSLELLDLEEKFISWVHTDDSCRYEFDNGLYGFIFDDITFINWLKNIMLVKDDNIEIIVSHAIGHFDDSFKVDGIIYF